MKYDDEYNSYKFSDKDIETILVSLLFYEKYSPLEQEDRNFVENLYSDLKNSINSARNCWVCRLLYWLGCMMQEWVLLGI